MTENKIREKINCNICNYEWIPKRKTPVQCPKCKRNDYNKTK